MIWVHEIVGSNPTSHTIKIKGVAVMSKLGRDSFMKIRKPIPPTGGEMKCKRDYRRKKHKVREFIEKELEEYEQFKEEENVL